MSEVEAKINKIIQKSSLSEDLKALIVSFLSGLKARGYSKSRLMSFLYTINEFMSYVLKHPKDLTTSDIRKYIDYLSKKGNNSSTIKEKMIRIRVFLRWALGLPNHAVNELLEFFSMSPKPTKGKNSQILDKIISEREFKLILKHAKHPREKALISLIFETGARIGELLNIRIKDLDLENKYVIVGGKRIVPVLNTKYIEEWLEVHPNAKNKTGYLFCLLHDHRKKLTYSTARKILSKILKRAGLKKKITFHMFRHTRATLLAKLGVSPYAMNQVMGWSASTRMWQVYLHISDSDSIREILEKISRKNNRTNNRKSKRSKN